MIIIKHKGVRREYGLVGYIGLCRGNLSFIHDYNRYEDQISLAKEGSGHVVVAALGLNAGIIVAYLISMTLNNSFLVGVTSWLCVFTQVFIMIFGSMSYFYTKYYCERQLNSLAVPAGMETEIRTNMAELDKLKTELFELKNGKIETNT